MAEATAKPPLAAGDLIELKGLTGARNLNGRRGRAVKYVKKDKRWAIRLESTGEVVKAKIANIEILGAQILDGTPTERDTSVPLDFNVGDRVECLNYHTIGVSGPKFEAGTVAKHWHREESWPRGLYAAYLVQLDNGVRLHCKNSESYIRNSEMPPVTIQFKVGGYVMCKLGDVLVVDGTGRKFVKVESDSDTNWEVGLILEANSDWLETGKYPYLIEFHGRCLKFWGTAANMKECTALPVRGKSSKLRFKIGQRVDCCSLGGGWVKGTIVDTMYEDASILGPNGVHPYQIQLDTPEQGQSHIMAPADSDGCIRKSTTPCPECFICCDTECDEDNLIVRECACKGDKDGLAKTKFKDLQKKYPDEDDPLHHNSVETNYDRANPFEQCLTCKANFSFGGHCHVALLKECISIYSEEDDLDSCQTALKSIIKWCNVLIQEGKFEDAKVLLFQKLRVFRRFVRDAENDGIDTRFFNETLVELLNCLACAHEKTKMLVWMKSTLDEALSLSVNTEGFITSYQPMYMTKAELVRYTFLTGDIGCALAGAEALLLEARSTNAHVREMLRLCAPLNSLSGDKERCLEQFAEAAKIEAGCWGEGSPHVQSTTWLINRIRDDVNIKCVYRADSLVSWDWFTFT
ncbi:hypothetical protein THAOC_18617 [Thalassiosira oceanica]|uniref:Uncharacterized protein n=1 Tax=Thalassiosira oceanica TaxID=159749 RepID=K0S7P5_THAOC|nr:hypothetical protein THAOC_18617 [Thalassiosira oceanica]|eukprot:EJK60959.1 hypothetical protein THAOC_18617 [Thalassiosira oceanica]